MTEYLGRNRNYVILFVVVLIIILLIIWALFKNDDCDNGDCDSYSDSRSETRSRSKSRSRSDDKKDSCYDKDSSERYTTDSYASFDCSSDTATEEPTL